MSDLFGIDDTNNDILGNLDDNALHDKHYWPGDLVELSEVIRSQLEREGVANEAMYRQVDRILLAMSFLCGGRNYYLPSAQRVKNALRDKRIYDEFNGRNHRALARQYKLSEQKIYAILRQQTVLHRQRLQPRLAL